MKITIGESAYRGQVVVTEAVSPSDRVVIEVKLEEGEILELPDKKLHGPQTMRLVIVWR